MKKILSIHAVNVTAMGPVQVVSSLLSALENIVGNEFSEIRVFIPDKEPLSEMSFNDPRFKLYKVINKLPNAISRTFDTCFPCKRIKNSDVVIVLGDIPLRVPLPQVVLVHQPHLISPKVDPHVYTSVRHRFMRFLFARNIRYLGHIVVQTAMMAEALQQSYPSLKGRVHTMYQPAPTWFNCEKIAASRVKPLKTCKLRLFYPAAYYPHKNHKIIGLVQKESNYNHLVERITLTIRYDECSLINSNSISFLGRISASECMNEYARADALFFPSIAESYGLPLVEAMLLGMPVICSDLPYAHDLCGKEAIYFDPEKASSVIEAFNILQQRLKGGWQPDWSSQLGKLPKDWEEVSHYFLKTIQ